jgi:hypothetical protein
MLLTNASPPERGCQTGYFCTFGIRADALRPFELARSLYEQKSPPQRPSMAQSFRNAAALSGYIARQVKRFFRTGWKKLHRRLPGMPSHGESPLNTQLNPRNNSGLNR